MGGSQKSKRITWAPDVNLCQVRVFSSANPPSEVRKSNVDHLRGKATHGVRSNGRQPNDSVQPPGFEKIQPRLNLPQMQTQPRLKLPQITLTKWRCPPRFEVNSEWLVASGEESEEMETQIQREKRVLEAIYPWPSAIPPSAHAPLDAEESVVDDHNIPVIPIKPIEETDAGLTAPSVSSDSIGDANIIETPVQQQLDVAAAAAATRAALASNPSLSNLIDHDLLLRILTDKKLLQQLLFASNGASSQYIPELKEEPKNCSYSTNITRPELNEPQLRTGFVPPMKVSHDASSQYIPELKIEPKNSQRIPVVKKVESKNLYSTNITRPELKAPQLRTGFVPPMKDSHDASSQYIPELKVEPKNSQRIPEVKKVESKNCSYSTNITRPELKATQLRTGFVPQVKDSHDSSLQYIPELKVEPKSSQCIPEVKKVESKNCSYSTNIKRPELKAPQLRTGFVPPMKDSHDASSQYIPELKVEPKNSQCIPEMKVEPKNCSYSTNIKRSELNAPQLRTESVRPLKDISYLKSLIQQHGVVNTRDDQSPLGQSNWVMGTQEDESRSRRRKRCMFFNSARGCKNGANCTYLHDTVSSRQFNCFTEDQTAKRVKRNWIHS